MPEGQVTHTEARYGAIVLSVGMDCASLPQYLIVRELGKRGLNDAATAMRDAHKISTPYAQLFVDDMLCAFFMAAS